MNQYIILSKRQKTILCVTIILLLVLGTMAAFVVEQYYRFEISNFEAKDGQQHTYYVYPGATMDSIIHVLQADYHIASVRDLQWHLKKMDNPNPQPGFYRIPEKMGNKALIRKFQLGQQSPVHITFTNVIRTKEQLAGRLATQLLMDSTEIIQCLSSDDYMAQYGLNAETSRCLFLPDTYEVFWSMTADELFTRMDIEYHKFWNSERMQKADSLHLTPVEISILASIVEREQNESHKDEFPIIASLYLNRVHRGMHLQACPTVKYAVGDFKLRRVLNSHLKTDSPYNTYMYPGLPPGPIGLPKKTTIDAVLNAPTTNYLFMCANTDGSGTHIFSTSYSQHVNAANQYHDYINEQNIK